MTRSLLTLLLVAALGCKGSEPAGTPGPALTPVVANQLRALADQCTVRTTRGRIREVRTCTGRQAEVTIHLDGARRLVELEVAVYAALRDEAVQLIEQALRGVVSETLLAELKPRLNRTNDSVRDGAVELRFRTTKQDNQNPRYTIVVVW